MEDLEMTSGAGAQPFGNVFSSKRVFITGHTGFKGSWLTAWLLSLGAEISGFSKGPVSEPNAFEAGRFAKDIRHTLGDIRDADTVRTHLHDFKPDFVFHLAAQSLVSRSYADPLETITTNTVGTANVLSALRTLDRPCAAVIVTSDKCYENVEWPWGYRETDHLGGRDIYSGSKGAAEIVFHAFQRSFFSDPACGVRMATGRAGNVIGGGDWAQDRIVADCMRAWTEGRSVEIRSPRATRPWQHVLEPLSGYLRLAQMLVTESALQGEQFNFGPRAEQSHTVLELISILAGQWGFDSHAEAFRVVGDAQFHEAGLLKLNCDKALMHLRWEPTLTLDECLHMTGDWYRRYYRSRESARDLINEQLASYTATALKRQRAWLEG